MRRSVPVQPEENEPVFHSLWEARTFGMAVAVESQDTYHREDLRWEEFRWEDFRSRVLRLRYRRGTGPENPEVSRQ